MYSHFGQGCWRNEGIQNSKLPCCGVLPGSIWSLLTVKSLCYTDFFFFKIQWTNLIIEHHSGVCGSSQKQVKRKILNVLGFLLIWSHVTKSHHCKSLHEFMINLNWLCFYQHDKDKYQEQGLKIHDSYKKSMLSVYIFQNQNLFLIDQNFPVGWSTVKNKRSYNICIWHMFRRWI